MPELPEIEAIKRVIEPQIQELAIEKVTVNRPEVVAHPSADDFCTDSDTIKGYQQFAYDRGVFSRPFLNYLYAMVPYVIKEEELVKVLQTMKEWFSKAH